ncbi:MAG: aldo/keto reductase [Planctomycetes bacterium]|nr:aldo/keto reductase [Planctomycetota bacterium]
MEYRELGSSSIYVSAVTMGCWAIVGDATWGAQDEREAIDTIRAALDLGVTTFDTAEGYGAGYSEELLAKALADRSEKAVILSKVSRSHLGAAEVKVACEASLKRLRRDHIDLYQIHWPSRKVPLDETLRALEDLRTEGKIRAIGVSNFARRDLSEIIELGRIESDQLPYSLLFRAIEYEVTDLCVANDISILCYSPLAQGLLTGKFATADDVPEGRARTRLFSSERPNAHHGEPGAETETFEVLAAIRRVADGLSEPMGRVALAWLLSRPGVATVIAGARNIAQVAENAKAASLHISADDIDRLTKATDTLKAKLGPNTDMWESQSRMR